MKGAAVRFRVGACLKYDGESDGGRQCRAHPSQKMGAAVGVLRDFSGTFGGSNRHTSCTAARSGPSQSMPGVVRRSEAGEQAVERGGCAVGVEGLDEDTAVVDLAAFLRAEEAPQLLL